MTNIVVLQEEELKRLMRECIRETLLPSQVQQQDKAPLQEEPLLTRQQMAAELNISLVTLTDWMKKGLPYLRMNGRVYFRRSEVIASMKHNCLTR